MDLRPTQELSNYRLVEQIGEGGMGVVWKALDTTLDREVAIKILPRGLASDAQRLARFQREAKMLASLNHPNIATIHGLHEDQGVRFLAMELLGGQDLSTLLASGPISVREALRIGRDVAAALEEAHRNAIVHRDLKPGNVRVTDGSQIKVLDFGLARRVSVTATAGPDSNTVTQLGHVVGTAPYMSPEQARGQPVDKQADVWAFGCLLYEMLTGRVAFAGQTASDCVAQILTSEPDFDRLPPMTPRALYRLLKRCLEKDPGRRWKDIGDARLELEEMLSQGDEAVVGPEPASAGASIGPSAIARLVPWLVTLGAVVLALVVWQLPSNAPSTGTALTRVIVRPAPGAVLSPRYATVAVPSPDGSMLVYVALTGERRQLWLRPMDDLTARALPGTDGAWQPFFSPDGSSIGFFADRKLKKLAIADGAVEEIAEIGNNPRGGSWGADGWIVLTPTQTSGLIRIHAEEGTVEPLTKLDFASGESTHRWPQVLPDGRGVLYTARTEGTSFDQARLVIDPLDGEDPTTVMESAAHGRYTSSGHLVFVRGGRLFAVGFDLDRLQTAGEPARVVDGVTYSPRNGGAQFSVSENGTLVYRPGANSATEAFPLWIDMAARRERIDEVFRGYEDPRLSPNSDRLLLRITDSRGSRLWTLDLSADTFQQVTHRDSVGGRWVDPQGRFIVFAADEPGRTSLFLRTSDGLGDARLLVESPYLKRPCTVTSDGRFLIYQERRPESGWDLMVLELDRDGAPVESPRALLATPANEEKAHLSRDDGWVGYESDELDGLVQIYVRSFPAMEHKRKVSETGARGPRFSPTRNEVYFWSTGSRQFRAVDYEVADGILSASAPRRLLEQQSFSTSFGGDGGVLGDPAFVGYDLAPKGDRFVMLELEPTPAPAYDGEIVVVLNWFRELAAEPER